MGMAASQVNFSRLQSRDFAITLESHKLTMQKTSLAREMQQISLDYRNSLSAKKLQWSNNAGISYTDINYSMLMRPNAANAKSPQLITDSSGKVVVDTKYKKYAEMISANGDAGGSWSGDTKNKILAELTGISEADIKAYQDALDASDKAAVARNKALEAYDKVSSKEPNVEALTLDKLAKKMGSYGGYDLSNLYSKGDKSDYKVRSLADIQNLINGIKSNLGKYFIDDEALGLSDKTAFNEACDATIQSYKNLLEASSANADKDRESEGLKGSYNDWNIDISMLFGRIMGYYNGSKGTDSSGSKAYIIRDASSSQWTSWRSDYLAKKSAYEASETAYSSSVSAYNQCLTASQETDLEYYNLLFQSIADNGWMYDNQANDSDYLTQMLENSSYCITTITKNECFNPDLEEDNRNVEFYYDTNIASNCKNIFPVNDSDATQEALVDYEYKKGLINDKESRIDQRLKKLQTEQAAIKKMMESINNTKKDNIERTFNLWS